MDLSVEVEIERERTIVGEFVDLGQDVQVWKVHLEHRSEREEETRNVQRWQRESVGVDEVENDELLSSVKMQWQGGQWERTLYPSFWMWKKMFRSDE